MIYVGIDFGHGETTVSRAPGYNGEKVSQIALRLANNNEDKKVISAVCKKKGNWALVNGEGDFSADDLREGFKAMVHCPKDNFEAKCMSDRDKESMREFAKLIFEAILQHDTDLVYNSPTDKNFELGIACPSDWVRKVPEAQNDYLEFFRNECGLPVDYCIKESDAAFFSKFDRYDATDCVFVIDLGSSTIDFTTYSQGKCIKDCCWGENMGAHRIDDALVNAILQEGENSVRIQRVNDLRINQMGFITDAQPALSLYVRKAKENYYLLNPKDEPNFILSKELGNFVPVDGNLLWEPCVRILAPYDKYNTILAPYVQQMEQTLNNAKTKLNQYGITPNRILLSGGASRMPFIREYTEQIFGVRVDLDQQPECVVSNGIALYAQALAGVTEGLPLASIDYKELYKQADRNATLDATKQLFPEVLRIIEGSKDLTGNEMFKEIAYFFYSLNPDNEEYVKLLNESVNRFVNQRAFSYIQGALEDAFKVRISEEDVNITVEAQALYYHLEFFTEGAAGQKIYEILVEATGPHIFTSFDPDRSRSISDRNIVARLCRERLCVNDPFGVGYDEGCLIEIADSIREQCISEAKRIILSKQLFETTFKE